MGGPGKTEPWLRGTLTEVPAMHRAVLHALQLAEEDLTRWCAGLTQEELNASPGGIASVAFHLRHIARSVDRLLAYAEGRRLSEEQLGLLSAGARNLPFSPNASWILRAPRAWRGS